MLCKLLMKLVSRVIPRHQEREAFEANARRFALVVSLFKSQLALVELTRSWIDWFVQVASISQRTPIVADYPGEDTTAQINLPRDAERPRVPILDTDIPIHSFTIEMVGFQILRVSRNTNPCVL